MEGLSLPREYDVILNLNLVLDPDGAAGKSYRRDAKVRLQKRSSALIMPFFQRRFKDDRLGLTVQGQPSMHIPARIAKPFYIPRNESDFRKFVGVQNSWPQHCFLNFRASGIGFARIYHDELAGMNCECYEGRRG